MILKDAQVLRIIVVHIVVIMYIDINYHVVVVRYYYIVLMLYVVNILCLYHFDKERGYCCALLLRIVYIVCILLHVVDINSIRLHVVKIVTLHFVPVLCGSCN